MPADSKQNRSSWFQAMLPTIVWDGLCPFLIYRLSMKFVPGISQAEALGAGAIFVTARVALHVAKRRKFDAVGVMVLVGIAAGIVALAFGSTRLFLMRESFLTGALGLLALSSFLWPRPLLFYIGRQFAAGDNPVALKHFNAAWQYPGARRAFRIMTLVWTVGWLAEAALRVIMVLTLSVSQVLVISPVLFNGVTIGLMAWTIAYGTRVRRQHEQPRNQFAP